MNEIKKLDKNETYVASIKFLSQGDGEQVAIVAEFSHPLAEDFDDVIPASYATARDLVLKLQAQAVLYAPTDEDVAFLNDPEVSAEDKAKHVLESATAQEEALNATIN